MSSEDKRQTAVGLTEIFRTFYELLAVRAWTVIIYAAIFCTLAVKFFHALRNDLVFYYPLWILTDVIVLLFIEIILTAVYFLWPGKNVYRLITFLAALVCTWSVINACWLIRNGIQILPTTFLPLFREPLNSLYIVTINFIKIPRAAVTMLVPSAVALVFFFYCLAKPRLPDYSKKKFFRKTLILSAVIIIALFAKLFYTGQTSVPAAAIGLRYNAQLKAITFIWDKQNRLTRKELREAKKIIPFYNQAIIKTSAGKFQPNYNVVIVVLEGVQYRYTSLYNENDNSTPYLLRLAAQGVSFENMRSSMTHTTKALFGIFTGFYPSASMDIAEAVPVAQNYMSLPMVLKNRLNYKTAFFQSAKGNFESRPGLVANLGFDKFWTRENVNDSKTHLGYLASDEFCMLKPITDWIQSDDRPFLVTILCSVTHDPYQVPDWYAKPQRQLQDRYKQTISYTDSFIEALDIELKKLNLSEKTIFCVIGDHGEAFGEHGFLTHERIAFDEALRVPWIMRAPLLIDKHTVITKPVSSVDFTPTILSLLGFDSNAVAFEGLNVLGNIPDDRKVHFSCWMQQGPSGFVQGDKKYIYYPADDKVRYFNLAADPMEANAFELPDEQGEKIADELVSWRKGTVFKIRQQERGSIMVFDNWLCKWNNRICDARYKPINEK
jgi:phosphoglycerol transferase MdoB-like AlkP superfamily enzyme